MDILLHHRDRLRRLDPDTSETRLLQMLVEQRRKLVHERTRYSNRLTAGLKLYFPQALDWFDDIDSPLSCAFLEEWPTLDQAQHVHPGTLKKFFRQHNCRSQQRLQERFEAIQQAMPAVTDTALLTAGPAATHGWVALLQVLQTGDHPFG